MQEGREELQALLGNLTSIAGGHGSVAETLDELLVDAITLKNEVTTAQENMVKMRETIKDINTQLEKNSDRVLTVITKVSRNCSTKIGLVEQRMAVLEALRLRVDTGQHGSEAGSRESHSTAMLRGEAPDYRVRTQAATPVGTSTPQTVDCNTIFGQANIGGSSIDLTVNSLFAMIQTLETQ